mgnify:FL=1|jgi:hypothetical protein|tara:strand:+ start:166 stop:294 length:129 start_codon:yes stop_codon:yes gene_type:complete
MNEEEIIELTIIADVHMSCVWANDGEPIWPLGGLNHVMGVDV